jgi:hypothetical protein
LVAINFFWGYNLGIMGDKIKHTLKLIFLQHLKKYFCNPKFFEEFKAPDMGMEVQYMMGKL